jgi:hypothetical protein
MRWRAVTVAGTVVAAVGAVLLGAAGPAFAKGADQATITGPGLARPIVLGGDGEPGSGETLGTLSNGSGLFVVMFGPTDGRALSSDPPAGSLGPRYELAFRVPGASPTPDIVRQDLYPSAPGGPVTYTPGGQPSFGGRTSGGWYRSDDAFARLLASIGVPEALPVALDSPSAAPTARPTAVTQPDVAGRRSVPAAAPWVAVAAVLLVLVALVALRRRRAGAPQDAAMR